MYSSLEEAFEFCWSLFAKHKPIIKARNIKSNKLTFGPPLQSNL